MQKDGFYPGGVNDPVAVKTGTVYSELSLLASDWPGLGHMPTIEPITGV